MALKTQPRGKEKPSPKISDKTKKNPTKIREKEETSAEKREDGSVHLGGRKGLTNRQYNTTTKV